MQQRIWAQYVPLVIVTVSAVSTVSRGTGRSVDGRHSQLRSGLRTQNLRCPGLKAPCSGNGECDPAGLCWCKLGYGGTDCTQQVPDTYKVDHVNDPTKQDMLGVYSLVPMYLEEGQTDPRNKKFIHYDPLSEGWAISKLNSSCTDDICFFAYSKGQEMPPPKGYVFGQPDKHVYYKQLVFDDTELFPGKLPGYHMVVSYSPDPNAVGVSDLFNQFTGRYIVQPRFIHKKTGKYAIMPVSLNAPGKLWVILALEGVGPARKWNIIAQTQDLSLNRYTIPKGTWDPPQMGLVLEPSCPDQVTVDVCFQLSDHCSNQSPDSKWVRACCRQTCDTCRTVAANECVLPKTGPDHMTLLRLQNKTSAVRG